MSKNEKNDEVGYIELNFDDDVSVQEKMDEYHEKKAADKKTKKKAEKKTFATAVPGITKRYTNEGVVYDATYYNGKETYFDKKEGKMKERVDRPKKTFKTFQAANDWLNLQKGERAKTIALGKSVVIKTYTLIDVLPIYREHCKKIGKSDNYFADYDRHCKRYKNYFVGALNKPVSAIDAGDITDYLTYEFENEKYAKKTLEKLRSTLCMIWDFMVERSSVYNVTVNVARQSKIYAPDSEYEANMLNYKQIGELIKEACDFYDPTFLYLVVMSMTQGLRRGELCGLKWGDIDFKTNKVTIQHNRIQRLKNVKLPKMEKKRVIELHKAGRDVIDLYKKWQEKYLGGNVSPNAYVMQWEVNLKNDYNPSVGKISRRWKEIYAQMNKNREKAGKEIIPYGRLHDGRHIYLTNMTHGIKKDNGTIIPSVNLFQAYYSTGHTLPKALQNVATQSYIEDIDARWDVTRFWNDALEVDVADLWRTMEEIRQIDWETMTELEQLTITQRRQKEMEKALKEHLKHLKENDEILQIRTDEGEFSEIDDDDDTDEE